MKTFWRLAAMVALIAGFGTVAFAGPANAADDSTWLCKPGQADNPCLGNVDGNASLKGGGAAPLGYKTATDPKVDCFYVYPTQSNQHTANANLNPDKELKDVAINQARQFSRVCDVYAPLYRQYTFAEPVTPEVREIAYGDVVKAWNDYLENYNNGRGVIIMGHSQGSSHLARMINEKIDNNAEVRDKVISAIIPGANVYVPKGKNVGGQFQNIPECESDDQLGCVIAYSMYNKEPDPGAGFGRVGSGYWVNPNPRPDPNLYEVMCTNPAELSGDNGNLEPLADLGLFLSGNESPFLAQPDYYKGECKSTSDANWLNVSKIDPSDPRLDLAGVIDSGDGNLHLGDVSLAEANLVSIASTEAASFESRETARARLTVVQGELGKASKSLKSQKGKVKKLKKKLKKAKKKCRKAKKAHKKVKKRCRPKKSLKKRIKTKRKAVRNVRATIKSHQREITDLNEVV
ncbi:MAG: DUF3089 domain-containing protein [Solirubrobacterales bacterium]|nr:DUF3089 domain-containing protein [Solirubrobacterales bacterium]